MSIEHLPGREGAFAEVDGRTVDPGRAAALAGAVQGYGHFTAMRVEGGRVRGLAHHLERLQRDCAEVFGGSLEPARVRDLVHRAVDRCPQPVMVRVTVFDPDFSAARPLASGPVRPSVLVTTRPVTPPPDRGGRGLRLRTTRYVRDLPAVKHLGLFGALHQRKLAQQAGFDDALFVTDAGPGGRLCEGPTWNVALLIDHELAGPDGDCLPGVTGALVREVLADLAPAGPTAVLRPVLRAELADARAAFVTSAGVGLVPVAAVDGVDLPGDPHLLQRLRDGYAQLAGDPL